MSTRRLAHFSWVRLPIPLRLTFTAAETRNLRAGLQVRDMDDKWAGQWDATVPGLQFSRSWTGVPWYRVPITQHADKTASVSHFWVSLYEGKKCGGLMRALGALSVLPAHRSIVQGLLVHSSAYACNSDGEETNVLMSEAEMYKRMWKW